MEKLVTFNETTSRHHDHIMNTSAEQIILRINHAKIEPMC